MKYIYKIIFLIGFFSLSSSYIAAQQMPVMGHYLSNKYLLSPSFGGIENESIIFVGHKREWASVPDGPKTSYVNAYFPASENVWLGGQVISDKAGLFTNTQFSFSYIYHLQINNDSYLDFSVWGSLLQNSVNLVGLNQLDIGDDPLLQNVSSLSGTALNAGTALNYRYKDGNIGVSIPLLFNNKDAYANGSGQNLIVYNRHLVAYASYLLRINYDVDLEPTLVYRSAKDFASQIEASLLLTYRDNYWIGGTYKDIGKTAIHIGAEFAFNFILNYTYEFATGSNISQNAASHEFSLGFKLGQNNGKNRWRNYLRNR